MININGREQDAVYPEVVLIKTRLLNNEIWFGKSADQSGNDWATEFSMTPFQVISGAGTWGADANDEAKVFGTLDTPARAGKVAFDIYRIVVSAVSHDTPYYLRIVYGTGTMAAAITALQYTTVVAMFDSANPTVNPGIALELAVPKLDSGTKVWVQAKNATDNATIDFFVGIHEYDPV